jgi:predicted transcriptional regulator
MGASRGIAMSLAPIVLIVLTAPLALADPLTDTIPAPVDPDGAITDAQERAGQSKAKAESTATEARLSAEDQALSAYGTVTGTVSIAWGYVEDTVGDAYARVTHLLGDASSFLQTGSKPNHDQGVTTQSSQTIVHPEIFQASLLLLAASTGASVFLIWIARRLVTLGGLPLLSRIAHSEIYENDARRTVSELVIGEPGLCLNDIVGRTGFSRNAVSYHLFVLEKEEEIVSVKDGKYRRYFTRNGKYVNGAKNVVAALRNETTLKLAQVVAQRPGAIQRELCIELGATPSATCWHAKRLLELGVIRKEKVSNTVQYFPGEALAKYDLSDLGLPKQVSASPAPAI